MSELNPYQAAPYRQRAAGSSYPSDLDVAFQSGSGMSSVQNGYYSADDLGDQSLPFPAASGGQMALYLGDGQQSYSQPYWQPYSQQYPYPSPSYGPYPPYGQAVYWGVSYDPRRYEANALGGWALGLGIASIVANCFYFGLILGVPAIVVGVLGVGAANEGRASNKGLSIAGVATGAIGAIISAVSIIPFMVMMLR
ncbi:DUF4190 domain-containing protein [Actinomyces oris]|uniref:DUF4190 domain-containing protein n=1 Tax=Actinomyces oris TaxID=544580 RepID=UPI0028896307|nr:DUF4190 domain-containing protein [Actinomyces oris]